MRAKFLYVTLSLAFGAAFGTSAAEFPPAATVKAKVFRIVGSKAFTEAQLLRLIEDSVGRPLTPADLDGLARRITAFYREHGYWRARATLPSQNFKSGTIRFLIVKTPIGRDNRATPRAVPETIAPGAMALTNRRPASQTVALTGDPAAVLLNRARMWEGRDRPDLARETLKKLFLIAPDYPDALAEQAFLEIDSDQTDAARKLLDRLYQVAPDHPAIPRIMTLLRLRGSDEARLRQARVLEHSGRIEAALSAFKALFPDGPPDGNLALEYWQLVANTANGWEAAQRGLSKLVKNYPDNLRYRLALAEHETSRQPINRKALQVIIEFSKIPSYERDALAAWRNAVLRLDQSPASIALLREYLARDKGDAAVRQRLEAFVHAEIIHRQLMTDPSYRAKLEGLALLDGGKIDAAEERLEQALAGRPKDADAVGGMGLVRLRQGRYAEARGYFLQAIQLDPARRKKWTSLVKTAKFWGLMQESGDAREAGEFALAERKLRQALRLDPREPNAFAALAHLQADRGRLSQAEKTFRQALLIEPTNRSALSGLISLYLRQNRNADARSMIVALSPAQRNVLGHTLNALQAGMMRDEAGKLLAEGHSDAATAVLVRAVATDADDPWLRFTLARLYAGKGMKEKGRALFDDLLVRHPDDAAALYALALYQSGQDDDLPALATLERIDQAERTANMTELQRRLWVRVEGQRAMMLAKAGQPEKARQVLTHAETSVAGDAQLSTSVALEWADLGDTAHARALFERIKAGSAALPVSWHLRYAAFLNRSRAELELQAELDKISSGKLSAGEAATLAELRESAAIRAAGELRRAGRLEAAHRVLMPFLSVTPNRIPLLLAEAGIFRTEHRYDAAAGEYRRILAANPLEADARDGLIDTLVQAGKRPEALAMVEQQLAKIKPAEIDRRLTMVAYLNDLGAYSKARAETDALLIAAPDNARVLAYAGQLARRDGRLDEAIDYLQRSLAAEQLDRVGEPPLSEVRRVASAGKAPRLLVAPAPAEAAIVAARTGSNYQYRQLAEMLDQRTTWLSSAADWRSRAGTAGVSQFDSREIPVEWKSPWRAGGQTLFWADAVRLDAGTLDLADTAGTRAFGSLLLCQPNCPTDFIRQSVKGVSFNAGYQRKNLKVDVGTTPLGFPVWHLVGGVRKDGALGPFSYAAEASRRPVTSSLLSFAGTRDPRNGTTWGGVVASGVRLGLSLDEGGALGAWSSLGLHRLTGENVQSNDRVQLMAGGYWRVVNEDDRLFTLGLTGMVWRFKEDAGEYSFGHGGYYSPKNYRSLSFPVTFGQRFPRFSYVLRASVSASQSAFNDAPYYPTDGALQAQAGNPRYAASSGPGHSWAFAAALEYQVEPKLFLGGRLDIERSDYYAPDRLEFYLRYALDHSAAQPVQLPPEPVVPASQF